MHRDYKSRADLKSARRDGDYSSDELEFLVAMDRYKRARRRPFPTWVEVLDVLKELGWTKAKCHAKTVAQ